MTKHAYPVGTTLRMKKGAKYFPDETVVVVGAVPSRQRTVYGVRRRNSPQTEWVYSQDIEYVIAEPELSVGDRVVFSSNSMFWGVGEDNPSEPVEGTIVEVHPLRSLPLKIRWDNGMLNTYGQPDIRPAPPRGDHIVVAKGPSGSHYHPSHTPYVHKTEASAKAEAKRLAGENPGTIFTVFKATAEETAEPKTAAEGGKARVP